MNDKKKILKLFTSSFYLSAFTFGGGYVILSLMENMYVKKYKWLTKEEMLDMTAIAQSAPGAVAVNASITVGYKIAGVLGAAVSCIGTILPPLILLSLISFFYDWFIKNYYIAVVLKGMQAGVCALIFSVVYDMIKEVAGDFNPLIIAILLISFISIFWFDISIINVMLLVILIGVIYALYNERKNNDVN